MPRSYGYWLDPQTGLSHRVSTHQHWILENAAMIGLGNAVAGLDPQRDEDRIRIIGCQAGLVRVRDYGARASVQFWTTEPERVSMICRALQEFMNEQGFGPLKSVWINNLATGQESTLTVEHFLQAVEGGASVFVNLE